VPAAGPRLPAGPDSIEPAEWDWIAPVQGPSTVIGSKSKGDQSSLELVGDHERHKEDE